MKIFLLFYMCDFAVGLTHCYKTSFFTFIAKKYLLYGYLVYCGIAILLILTSCRLGCKVFRYFLISETRLGSWKRQQKVNLDKSNTFIFYILWCTSITIRTLKLVAWYSGRTLVFDRRTFPVLRSTCSWWPDGWPQVTSVNRRTL